MLRAAGDGPENPTEKRCFAENNLLLLQHLLAWPPDLPYGCALYAYGKRQGVHVSEPFASYGRQDSERGGQISLDCHPCSTVFRVFLSFRDRGESSICLFRFMSVTVARVRVRARTENDGKGTASGGPPDGSWTHDTNHDWAPSEQGGSRPRLARLLCSSAQRLRF